MRTFDQRRRLNRCQTTHQVSPLRFNFSAKNILYLPSIKAMIARRWYCTVLRTSSPAFGKWGNCSRRRDPKNPYYGLHREFCTYYEGTSTVEEEMLHTCGSTGALLTAGPGICTPGRLVGKIGASLSQHEYHPAHGTPAIPTSTNSGLRDIPLLRFFLCISWSISESLSHPTPW